MSDAILHIGNEQYRLPIKKSTVGPNVIDISKLFKETGYFCYDPGFMSTASCTSNITFIDGKKAVLRHRGYDIKDIAKNKDFLELAHLLLYGEFPNKADYNNFRKEINYHSFINEQVKNIFAAFDRSAHPMAVILSVVGSLSAFYHDHIDMDIPESRELSAIRMIAKMPTICAMTYKYLIGQAFVYPREDLSFSENFLHMMFSAPNREYKISPILSRALDRIFILHADHEQNASTSTVRTCGSSGANPFACVCAGIASLWGPSHGGANEAVIKMLEEIGSVDNINHYIDKAKDPNDSFRLMGFGHRVYKNYDPRAEILRETCKEVLKELGMLKGNPLLEIAQELEEIALSDQYFIERKLYPNVDFYSGIIYQAMGIPVQMFTSMFALARCAGWISQWKEMWEDEDLKITRPRQLYTGHVSRKL